MAKNLFNNGGTGNSPKPDITHEDVNSHLMKRIADKEGTNIVAKPIDIFNIIPDITQPRRAIPFSVRSTYENTPTNITLMLESWHLKANEALGHNINVRSTIIEGGEGFELDEDSPTIAKDYIDLVGLAASIYREGLTNPITVSDVGDLKRIETGERRYLAHHLLTMYVDDVKFSKIAAQTVTRDVWRQASENGARKPLNAIGLARQLALLIMDMYEGETDVFFDKFEALVLPGECDRKFYAQVANGNRYRIKRGMSQKILDVTGLNNKSQITRHRNLLTIPDDIWVAADEGDWAEGRIRALLDEIRGTNQSGLNTPENADTLPIGNLSHQKTPHEAPVRPSYLPDRKPAPSHSQGYTQPDPDIDDSVYEDDFEPAYTGSSSQSYASTPPPPQQSSQAAAMIYAQRQAIAPTIRMITSYASKLDGQTITLNTGDKIFQGKTLMKMLEFYLEGNLQEIMTMIKEYGEEGMRTDIDEAFVNTLDIFEFLSREVLEFMNSVIDTALDYSD